MAPTTTTTKNSSMDSTSNYQDFEPYCEWQRDQDRNTLVLHLPEFKKDQLKVQVNNLGDLKISGERPLDGGGSKKSRFYKETRVPSGSDINEVHAKFSSGRLYVTMPKKSSNNTSADAAPASALLQPAEESQTRPDQGKNKSDHAQHEELVPAAATAAKEASSNSKVKPASAAGTFECMTCNTADGIEELVKGYRRTIARMTVGKKVAVGAGVAVAVVVAMGAYVAIKYKSSSGPSSHSSSSKSSSE